MTTTKITPPPRPMPLSPARPADEVKAPKKATPPPPVDGYEAPASTTFDPSRGVQNTDGRLSARAPYGQLPTDLKSKIDEKTWTALPEGQRGTIVDTYQRLKRYGAWDDVTKITGEKELREKPVVIGGVQTQVNGNSGDIQYEIKDKAAFEKKLTANGQFGVDSGKAGALHGDQTSMREVNGGDTSLHVSTGPGNRMDAHIDHVNPTNQPERGQTQLDVKRGLKHWRDEVFPEMARKVTGIPGIRVDGDVRPNPSGGMPEVRVTIGLEFHGVEKKKLDKPPAPAGQPVPPEVMARVMKRVEASGITFPVPQGQDPSNVPDRQAIADAVAAKINEAAGKGQREITIDLGIYAGARELQPQVLANVEQLAKIVKEEMAAGRADLAPADRDQMPNPANVTGITTRFAKKESGHGSLG